MMVVFIVIIFLILVAGHAGLYFSWVWLFTVKSLAIKKALAITLGILSISFIAGTLLVHFHEDFFSENLYIVSSVWLGLLWYLVLGTVLALVISWLSQTVGWRLEMRLITGLLLAVAVCLSAYGVWNALQIRTSRVNPFVMGLPESWRGKKAVQISDLHLGVYHGRSFMERIVTLVNDEHPDLIFITGDLFDGAGQKLSHLADPIDQLEAPDGVYYITGNHETYISLEKSLEAVSKTKARILNDEVVAIEGVQVVGAMYPTAGMTRDLSAVLAKLSRSQPSILLYHEPKVEIVAQAKQAGVNLMLSGHTHVGQLWPFGAITSALYRKLDRGLHREGDFSIYTSSGVGTWGPPMRIGNSPEVVVLTF